MSSDNDPDSSQLAELRRLELIKLKKMSEIHSRNQNTSLTDDDFVRLIARRICLGGYTPKAERSMSKTEMGHYESLAKDIIRLVQDKITTNE